MNEITNTETTNNCEPEAEAAAGGESHEPKPESLNDAEHAIPPMNLEQMVREAIDQRIAELFPPRREIPRVEAASGELLPEQRLRLGYGTREPNT